MKAIKIDLTPYIDFIVINADVFGNVIEVNVKNTNLQKQLILFIVVLFWINFISINVLVAKL